MVTAVVLAAGLARRMGCAKLLLPLAGKPVIRWVMERITQSPVDHIILVVGPYTDFTPFVTDFPVTVVSNPDAPEGMSSSLRAGIRAAPPGTTKLLFVLGDQPFVSPAVIAEMVAVSRGNACIVVPRYNGQRGHPVLFDITWRNKLLTLDGDRGARTLIEAYPGQVLWVDIPDSRPNFDMDTPADYQMARVLAGATDSDEL